MQLKCKFSENVDRGFSLIFTWIKIITLFYYFIVYLKKNVWQHASTQEKNLSLKCLLPKVEKIEVLFFMNDLNVILDPFFSLFIIFT